jgi:hypothetical protein
MTTRLNADLSVTPAEDRAITAAARREGLSKRKWITQVVRDRIDKADDTARIEQMIDRLDTETRARAASTTEQFTKQSIDAIRMEAARLTDYVVAAVQQAIPQTVETTPKDQPVEWGELVSALHKLGEEVASTNQVKAAQVDRAIKEIARCRKEFDVAQNNLKRVREKEAALIRVIGKTKSILPQLDDVFDLLQPITGLTYPN